MTPFHWCLQLPQPEAKGFSIPKIIGDQSDWGPALIQYRGDEQKKCNAASSPDPGLREGYGALRSCGFVVKKFPRIEAILSLRSLR
ncbi:MAG: hypothetical protein Ct9H300mP22_6740 [Gammaproteobacteria bacterium]|nr:MAG: hypothetical protein Ct9H300mP22_6740 [Gammaproteobacteria bacterium]